ncbi:TatD family hydrolase [Effusibacillus lacus]|uniref:Hydrolase TatD n=1 Tax=Effusibacillus lacus TaxID=1348429 RepID=A0A292YI06_9BACL|nr:TatD family hydrolase [Effusibacillus lacus]TCS74441.1 TatD DNase family protein [Effusibacillus lacus]GAX88686.1 hydrolase TatD [Effusibacillus lacus]
MLFDSHCHLNSDKFDDNDIVEMIHSARDHNVVQILVPGFDIPSSLKAVELAEDWQGVYAAVGIHPNDANHATEDMYEKLREWAQLPHVVAIGEIGLDYHWDTTPKEVQFEVFRRQIRLAREVKMPIVIHDREAHGDIVQILKEEGAREVGGIMHCFSGSWEMAKECMDMNFMISFGGPVTYKNAKRPQEVASKVPLDFLLVETDSPYLTPEPYRGKPNQPLYVRHVAEKIAELRGMEFDEISRITTENAERIFNVRNPFVSL